MHLIGIGGYMNKNDQQGLESLAIIGGGLLVATMAAQQQRKLQQQEMLALAQMTPYQREEYQQMKAKALKIQRDAQLKRFKIGVGVIAFFGLILLLSAIH